MTRRPRYTDVGRSLDAPGTAFRLVTITIRGNASRPPRRLANVRAASTVARWVAVVGGTVLALTVAVALAYGIGAVWE